MPGLKDSGIEIDSKPTKEYKLNENFCILPNIYELLSRTRWSDGRKRQTTG